MVLKELHHVSGLRISVHDVNHKEVSSYTKELTGFCHMMQEDREVYKNCAKNDSDAFNQVRKSRAIIKCFRHENR